MDDRLNEKLDIISKEVEYKIWRNLEDKYNKLRGNVYSFIDPSVRPCHIITITFTKEIQTHQLILTQQ